MDILSHGLWGGLAFGRKHKKSFWTAFAFGVTPDLFSFGVAFGAHLWSSIISGAILLPPRPGSGYENIPHYVFSLYDITHSLVIFVIAFCAVWIVLKKPLWEMSAWGLHIVMDIFTHSDRFFPTPFLWPISEYTFNGISWGHPWIFFPNVTLLVILYLYYFRVHKPRRLKQKQ